MDRHSLPSIEKFAAFLDGNLSQDEMQQFSQMAEQDATLHQLLDASSVVDETFAIFADADLQLPPEIVEQNFNLPAVNSTVMESELSYLVSIQQQESKIDSLDIDIPDIPQQQHETQVQGLETSHNILSSDDSTDYGQDSVSFVDNS